MLPWAMPAFVAFLTWRVLYQPIGGGINLILTYTGIYPQIIDWLGSRTHGDGGGHHRLGVARLPVLVRLHSRRAAVGAERALRRRRASMAPMPGSGSGR